MDSVEKLIEVENLKQELQVAKSVIENLKNENAELRQLRKDTPDIQQPYVILYRQIKKQLSAAEKCINNLYPIIKLYAESNIGVDNQIEDKNGNIYSYDNQPAKNGLSLIEEVKKILQ